jgi:hypothetical protein
MLINLSDVRPTPEFLRELLGDGAMFRAKFIKRTDGSVREMTAKLGVTQHVTGEGLKFSPEAKNLLGVFEMHQTGGYKFIPMEGLISIKVDGNTILFKDGN